MEKSEECEENKIDDKPKQVITSTPDTVTKASSGSSKTKVSSRVTHLEPASEINFVEIKNKKDDTVTIDIVSNEGGSGMKPSTTPKSRKVKQEKSPKRKNEDFTSDSSGNFEPSKSIWKELRKQKPDESIEEDRTKSFESSDSDLMKKKKQQWPKVGKELQLGNTEDSINSKKQERVKSVKKLDIDKIYHPPTATEPKEKIRPKVGKLKYDRYLKSFLEEHRNQLEEKMKQLYSDKYKDLVNIQLEDLEIYWRNEQKRIRDEQISHQNKEQQKTQSLTSIGNQSVHGVEGESQQSGSYHQDYEREWSIPSDVRPENQELTSDVQEMLREFFANEGKRVSTELADHFLRKFSHGSNSTHSSSFGSTHSSLSSLQKSVPSKEGSQSTPRGDDKKLTGSPSVKSGVSSRSRTQFRSDVKNMQTNEPDTHLKTTTSQKKLIWAGLASSPRSVEDVNSSKSPEQKTSVKKLDITSRYNPTNVTDSKKKVQPKVNKLNTDWYLKSILNQHQNLFEEQMRKMYGDKYKELKKIDAEDLARFWYNEEKRLRDEHGSHHDKKVQKGQFLHGSIREGDQNSPMTDNQQWLSKPRDYSTEDQELSKDIQKLLEEFFKKEGKHLATELKAHLLNELNKERNSTGSDFDKRSMISSGSNPKVSSTSSISSSDQSRTMLASDKGSLSTKEGLQQESALAERPSSEVSDGEKKGPVLTSDNQRTSPKSIHSDFPQTISELDGIINEAAISERNNITLTHNSISKDNEKLDNESKVRSQTEDNEKVLKNFETFLDSSQKQIGLAHEETNFQSSSKLESVTDKPKKPVESANLSGNFDILPSQFDNQPSQVVSSLPSQSSRTLAANVSFPGQLDSELQKQSELELKPLPTAKRTELENHVLDGDLGSGLENHTSMNNALKLDDSLENKSFDRTKKKVSKSSLTEPNLTKKSNGTIKKDEFDDKNITQKSYYKMNGEKFRSGIDEFESSSNNFHSKTSSPNRDGPLHSSLRSSAKETGDTVRDGPLDKKQLEPAFKTTQRSYEASMETIGTERASLLPKQRRHVAFEDEVTPPGCCGFCKVWCCMPFKQN